MANHGYLRLARTLHVYLTMFSSIVLFLFAFTGFVMNHESWFGVGKERGAPPRGQQAAAGADESRVEHSAGEPRADGAMGPRRGPDDRASGRPPAKRGLLSKLIAAHKGKPPALATTLLIDATALVLMLGSLTGIILLVSIAPRRRLGLTLMGAVTLAAVVVLLFFVP